MALNVSEGRLSRQGPAGASAAEEDSGWSIAKAVSEKPILYSNIQAGLEDHATVCSPFSQFVCTTKQREVASKTEKKTETVLRNGHKIKRSHEHSKEADNRKLQT